MCYIVFAKVNGDQTSFIECVIVLNEKKNKHFRFYVITPPPPSQANAKLVRALYEITIVSCPRNIPECHVFYS